MLPIFNDDVVGRTILKLYQARLGDNQSIQAAGDNVNSIGDDVSMIFHTTYDKVTSQSYKFLTSLMNACGTSR